MAKDSFLWASTACRYIIGSDGPNGAPLPGFPDERLKETLHTGGALDDMFSTVLNQAVGANVTEKSTTARRSLQIILGTLVYALEPVSVEVIAALASANPSVQMVDLINFHILTRRLSSIITGTRNTSSPLVAFHTSFTDFLIDVQRSQSYAVNASEMQSHLALASLAVMKKSLRFNICDLDSSFLRNDAVPGLTQRIKEHVPDALSYASRFWPAHVAAALSFTSNRMNRLVTRSYFHNLHRFTAGWSRDYHLRRSLSDFLNHKPLLLHWLEVMSLTGSDAYKALSPLSSSQTEYRSLSDLMTFTTYFAIPISTSVPHIYLSALAFTPLAAHVTFPLVDFPMLIHSDSPLTSWPLVRHTFAHKSTVNCVSFSPDGQRVVSGAKNGEISVWDVFSGNAALPQMSVSGAITSIAISPDGGFLASGSEDGAIQLWDMLTLSAMGNPVIGHGNTVWSVTFSPDGKLLASGSGDHVIRLWGLQGGLLKAKSSIKLENYILSLAFAPDGKLLASGSGDKTVRLWEVPKLRPVGQPLRGHAGDVRSVAYSPHGTLLVSGSVDKTIRFWDPQARSAVGEPLAAHDHYIYSTVFSPDGRTLASCSKDKTVCLWDTKSRSLLGKPLTSHTGSVRSIAFSPSGALLASGSSDKTVHVWDVRDMASIQESPAPQFEIKEFAALSPDGKLLASGSLLANHAIQLWDVRSVSAVREPLKGHADTICSVSFSPTSALLASGSDDMTVRIWDAHTGAAVGEPLAGHRGLVRTVAFSPDGKLLASGSNDHTVRLWNVLACSPDKAPLNGHASPVSTIAFSPDGTLLACGTVDCEVYIWNMGSRSRVGAPLKGHSDMVKSLVFSSNGEILASGSLDHSVRLWDVHTHSAVGGPLKGHTGWVTSLAFSADNTLLASCSMKDDVIRVWDVRVPHKVGAPVALLRHESAVYSVMFAPASPLLSSTTSGGVVRKWDLEYLLSPPPPNVHSGAEDVPTYSLSSPSVPFDLSLRSPDFAVTLDDGWVIGSNNELILWIPPAVRRSLYDLREIERFGGPPHVTLDFDDFVCGADWTKCYLPPSSSFPNSPHHHEPTYSFTKLILFLKHLAMMCFPVLAYLYGLFIRLSTSQFSTIGRKLNLD